MDGFNFQLVSIVITLNLPEQVAMHVHRGGDKNETWNGSYMEVPLLQSVWPNPLFVLGTLAPEREVIGYVANQIRLKPLVIV